ncbi:Dentin sialophosphoprotein-like protein [Hirschfeldia incana]|nr:Dentin sialophosphoprotein-like protein [Hirschfeldia incana]
MATEISSDLINRLNLSLRNEAKLSSLGDYTDSSTFTLPTAPEAIAELDGSAPYLLRCRNCKGKLLRGIESLICVFCGKQQRTNENPPDPIKFASTCGYKWFLSSLDLDGSEMVEPLKETNGSRVRAKAPVAKGIAVCEFLDFEVQWFAREEESLNNGDDDKNRLDLGGISLDDYSVGGRGDLSKVDPVESKPEDDDFKDPRSLSLFDGVKTQGVTESQQSEKDAEKNVSSVEHLNLSLFAGRRDAQDSVSLAEQGNFGFFEEKDVQHPVKEDGNLSLFEGTDDHTSSSSKNVESFGFVEGKEAQRNSASKDDESFGFVEGKDAQRNSASKEDANVSLFEGEDGQRNNASKEDDGFGLFEGALSSSTGLKSFDDKVVASSSDWDSDFQSVSQDNISGDPFVNSQVDLSAHMDSVFGSGKDLFHEKTVDSSTAYVSNAGDWLQDDLFGGVTGKTQNNDQTVHEGQVVGGNGSSSMDIDWMGDDLWQSSGKKAFEKTPTDDNDGDDDWNDFASSVNSKPPSNLLPQTMESSQEETFDGLAHVNNDANDQSKDEKQSTGTDVISDMAKCQEDDLFGAWDSFTSSTVLQTPVQPPTNHANSSAEQNQEMNLFREDNHHRDLAHGYFSESSGGQTNSEEVRAMPSGTSTLERMNDSDGKDQTLGLVGSTTASHKSKSDVAEELMSQMHDLSFMLETKLSVPPISKAE